VGAGGVAAGIALGDDDDAAPIVIDTPADDGAPASGRAATRDGSDAPRTAAARREVVVDDRIPAADARRAAAAGERRGRGTALTVDRDDGRYEVEVQQPDGRIVEVYVDDRFRPLWVDAEDGEGEGED
jgi:uncharacterized membrane protein YkoI